MNSPVSYPRRAMCVAIFLSVALPFPDALAGSKPGHLTVVFDEENLPYSSHRDRPAGLNVEIARLIVSHLRLDLETRWVNTLNEGLLSVLIEDGDAVQAAVGVPLEPRTVEDEELVGPEVLFSEPFASTRYVLVTRKRQPRLPNFRAIGRAPIGVQRGSVVGMRLWDEGFIVRGMTSQHKILEAIAEGDLDFGALWSNAGWLIRQDTHFRDTLRVSQAAPEVSGLAWNLAVAVSPRHPQLVPRLNEAIRALRDADAFEPLFEFYNVSYFHPIQSLSYPGSTRELTNS